MEQLLVTWLGVALVGWAFATRTMVPLRRVAIAAGLAFAAHGLLTWRQDGLAVAAPFLALGALLVLLNLLRLREVRATIAHVRSMAGKQPSFDALLPYMTPAGVRAGEALFRAGG